VSRAAGIATAGTIGHLVALYGRRLAAADALRSTLSGESAIGRPRRGGRSPAELGRRWKLTHGASSEREKRGEISRCDRLANCASFKIRGTKVAPFLKNYSTGYSILRATVWPNARAPACLPRAARDAASRLPLAGLSEAAAWSARLKNLPDFQWRGYARPRRGALADHRYAPQIGEGRRATPTVQRQPKNKMLKSIFSDI
jgi:hypothetical protein